MTTHEAFYQLVAQEPLKESVHDAPTCPYCDSKKLDIHNRSTTLVGYFGSKDQDPNHVTEVYRCCECYRSFKREYRRGNVWYVKPGENIILKGVAGCFEHYVYTCRHCKGYVERLYTALDGVSEVHSLTETIGGTRDYRIFYRCNQCQAQVETDFAAPTDTPREEKLLPPAPLEFKVVETIGESVGNIESLNRVEIDP